MYIYIYIYLHICIKKHTKTSIFITGRSLWKGSSASASLFLRLRLTIDKLSIGLSDRDSRVVPLDKHIFNMPVSIHHYINVYIYICIIYICISIY